MAEFRGLDAATIRAHAQAILSIAADVPGEYWTLAHFLDERPDKWRLSFAAWNGAEPVGYAILSKRGAHHVHLHHFMVAESTRGSGLGALMVSELRRRAEAARARRLTLKVAASNPRARAFYESHGFRVAGRNGDYDILECWLAPPVVAIHQPNYLPWLGYFAKMARADIFVFLDDVQFTKGGYTNRVQIDGGGEARWLTVPVRVSLGQRVNEIMPSRPDWRGAHLDTIATYYRDAAHYRTARDWLAETYDAAPDDNLAAINRHLIEATAARLGVAPRLLASSALDAGGAEASARLVRIVEVVAPGGTYLAGRGGETYQDPAAFANAGIGLARTDFQAIPYDQGRAAFLPGLSFLDAAFRIGWEGAAALVHPKS